MSAASHVRAVLRSLVLAPFTVLSLLLALLAKGVAALAPAAGEALHARVVRSWARGVALIWGMRVEVRGEPPRAPFFLVANHVSYADIILIYTQLSCVFLAKSEIAGWPIFGFLSRVAGTQFVDRKRKGDLKRVIAVLEDTLDRGRGVVVFPEGTSTEGAEVQRFKPSVFEVPAKRRFPVSCAAISYCTPEGAPPARLSICWWGDMPFVGHLYQGLGLPRFRALLSFDDRPLVSTDRKQLALEAREAVARRFTPVTGCVA